jgi:hypothetical protein
MLNPTSSFPGKTGVGKIEERMDSREPFLVGFLVFLTKGTEYYHLYFAAIWTE